RTRAAVMPGAAAGLLRRGALLLAKRPPDEMGGRPGGDEEGDERGEAQRRRKARGAPAHQAHAYLSICGLGFTVLPDKARRRRKTPNDFSPDAPASANICSRCGPPPHRTPGSAARSSAATSTWSSWPRRN